MLGEKRVPRPIAQSNLWYAKGRGARRRITVTIHAPEKDPLPGGDYRCLVTIRGLRHKRYACGIDSLQSLMLATVFLDREINALTGHGHRFYMSKSGEDAVDLALLWQADITKFEKLGRTKQASRRQPAAG